MRSHLRAGRPKRDSMLSARADSVSRSGTTTPRPAMTTVLPSRVGRRLQTWSVPKADAMRAALAAKLASRPNRLTAIRPPCASTPRQAA
jgi:hypothetical protein